MLVSSMQRLVTKFRTPLLAARIRRWTVLDCRTITGGALLFWCNNAKHRCRSTWKSWRMLRKTPFCSPRQPKKSGHTHCNTDEFVRGCEKASTFRCCYQKCSCLFWHRAGRLPKFFRTFWPKCTDCATSILWVWNIRDTGRGWGCSHNGQKSEIVALLPDKNGGHNQTSKGSSIVECAAKKLRASGRLSFSSFLHTLFLLPTSNICKRFFFFWT